MMSEKFTTWDNLIACVIIFAVGGAIASTVALEVGHAAGLRTGERMRQKSVSVESLVRSGHAAYYFDGDGNKRWFLLPSCEAESEANDD